MCGCIYFKIGYGDGLNEGESSVNMTVVFGLINYRQRWEQDSEGISRVQFGTCSV
jgi:hypothetical protein